jgi:hypothetical protein
LINDSPVAFSLHCWTMIFTSAAGFRNAPFSKLFLLYLASSAVIVSVLQWKKFFVLTSYSLLKQKQYWRIFSHSLVFLSESELLFGLVLAYLFRSFERQWGTSRYATVVLCSWLLTSLMDAVSVLFFTNEVSSGPYGVVFALTLFFVQDIPQSLRIRVGQSTAISEKFFVYLFAFQLWYTGIGTLWTVTGGAVVSMLFRCNACGLRHVSFPHWLFPTQQVEYFVHPRAERPPPARS